MPGLTDAKCILIIGATAGIGRALALAIHDLPTKPTVIIGGRRQERIDELCGRSERFRGVWVDVLGGREALRGFVEGVVGNYPEVGEEINKLDAVIFSSGIQHVYNFSEPGKVDLDLLDAELTTNYTSIYTMITFFLPHFLALSEKGRHSFIVPVTSTLASLPAPTIPGYCASKAAVHSLVLSLDHNLRNTNVHVMELIPPLTESELHDHQGTRDYLSKIWMPLDKFTEEAMDGLCRGGLQIAVGNAKPVWDAFEAGKPEAMVSPTRRP
ncbi:NAD(P)-binding protein [Trametopsis cervina]|nr:NAD(P)-binding protein [Trametopsis cervina]